MEMKPFGIDVVLIQPGAIKSNLGKNNVERLYFDEEGRYGPFGDAIRARVAFSQQPGATPTDEFAEKVWVWSYRFCLFNDARRRPTTLWRSFLFRFFGIVF